MWTELEQFSTVPVRPMLASSTHLLLHIWDFDSVKGLFLHIWDFDSVRLTHPQVLKSSQIDCFSRPEGVSIRLNPQTADM